MKIHDVAIQELKINFKENFETTLALKLLDCPEIVKAVSEVSKQISRLMKSNKQQVLELFRNQLKITEELFSNHYLGHFVVDDDIKNHVDKIFNLFMNTLADQKANFFSVLQLHCIFIHRVYDNIRNAKEVSEQHSLKKQQLVCDIFSTDLFNDRARLPSGKTPRLTTQVGINRNGFFRNRAGKCGAHLASLQKFISDKNSWFYQTTEKNRIPFVTGPSGHAGSLLLLGKLCDLNDQQLQHYLLAAFCFLTCGGNHSFHETMIVGRNLGLPFEISNYVDNIPVQIQQHEFFIELKEQFPTFLNHESFTRNTLC